MKERWEAVLRVACSSAVLRTMLHVRASEEPADDVRIDDQPACMTVRLSQGPWRDKLS
jgi:hypothetical protein